MTSDSPAMTAHVLASVLGHAQMMPHSVLSGSYEELGVTDHLLAAGAMGSGMPHRGVARPSYSTYRLLRALGDRRLRADGPVLASRRSDGALAAQVWNPAEVLQASGILACSPPVTWSNRKGGPRSPSRT